MPKVTRIPKIDVTISANAAFVPKLGVFFTKKRFTKMADVGTMASFSGMTYFWTRRHF